MGIIRMIVQQVAFRSFGAMGQYNLAKPVLADGEASILELDVNGNLLTAPGAGALWTVVGPAPQDAAVSGNPVEISYESEAIDGAAFDTNVPVTADGEVVRPKASRYGVPYSTLVVSDGSRTPAVVPDDGAYAVGSRSGVSIFGVRNDDAATDLTTGNMHYSPPSVDIRGRLFVYDSAPTEALYNYSTTRTDGIAVRASPTTITFTGPVLVSSQLCRVRVFRTANTKPLVWEQGRNATLSYAAGVITVWPFDGTADPVPATTTQVEVMWAAQDKAFDSPSNTMRNSPATDVADRRTAGDTGVKLIAADQLLTNAWADLGPEISTAGLTRICLWAAIDINDSLNVRFRALFKNVNGEVYEFPPPIYVTNTTATPWYLTAESEYIEWNVDATDFYEPFVWDLCNAVPWVQFQVMAGTAGNTPGNVLTAGTKYTAGFGA